MEIDWDVAVIGGSFSGLSAALMLVRSRRRVVVIDAGAPRNRSAAHMHGVLGHDGRSPLELLADGRREVERYGGIIRSGRAVSAARDDDGFTLRLDDDETLRARRLVVATGLRDELPEIDGLAEQWGRGVVICPYCDGWEARDSRIGILATGPFSGHQAQLLRQWSPRVTYLANEIEVPSDQARALEARGIEIVIGRVTRLRSVDGVLTGVTLDGGRHVDLDVIFIASRLMPNDGLLDGLGVERDQTPFGSFPKIDAMGATSVSGVWAIGKVANAVANVPVAMGAGSFAGAAVNMDLITAEIAHALETRAMAESA